MTFNSSTAMLPIPASPVNTVHSENLISNISSSVSETDSKSTTKRKKMKSEMPPKSITSLEETNSMFVLVLNCSFDDLILCWVLILFLLCVETNEFLFT